MQKVSILLSYHSFNTNVYNKCQCLKMLTQSHQKCHQLILYTFCLHLLKSLQIIKQMSEVTITSKNEHCCQNVSKDWFKHKKFIKY